MSSKRYNNTMGHYRTECVYCSHVAYACKIANLSGKGGFYREVTYRCDSDTCGLKWVCSIEPLRALSIAENKNNVPMLPLSKHLKERKDKLLQMLNQREYAQKPQKTQFPHEAQGELDV